MFNKINFLTEKDINKTPIENVKKVLNIKDDYMSHIINLMNNGNLPHDEKEQIMLMLRTFYKIVSSWSHFCSQ